MSLRPVRQIKDALRAELGSRVTVFAQGSYRNRTNIRQESGFIESFNAAVRRECLSQHYFSSVIEARVVVAAWRDEYNQRRPHGSLGQRTPAEVGAEARAGVAQESRSIAIVDPGASCEAASGPECPEILEDRERLALCEA